ncbi:inhibitor of KinA sporulation pathway (predicted exonuclease) [Umezawaea tangerina]|uniref:Inhibitor of KinA sporulation pathway (Predicted exonuclease) n=1 Tax=Umezawaea tangerina TaxID=84725 RepID=A0A2T0SBW1_9PSEU|nr:inhibitor of KinA sporulation pathway (predicted exonuclease) [Umezawaea tangerina]
MLVVDVEATCWAGRPPDGETSEIIEIGLCELDVESGRRMGKHSILVRPERSSVSEFCTSLTTLTPEQVAGGVTYAEACRLLRKDFRSRDRVWASYGDYDRKQFERQGAYPFGPRHLNVKTLFALTRNLPREVGLAEALRIAGLPLEGTHHRGDDDAWNIAALLAGILLSARR